MALVSSRRICDALDVGMHNEVRKRVSHRASLTAPPLNPVVDLLVYVDYSAYKQALKEHNYNRAATMKYLDNYYKLLVTLVNPKLHLSKHLF